MGMGALKVSGVRAIESMSTERSQDRLHTALCRARRIDIINTHQPRSAMRLGVEKTRDCRNKRTTMQRSRWRGRKPALIHDGLLA